MSICIYKYVYLFLAKMAEAYKLVAFDDISKTYAAGADVECTYTIKHPLQPSKYDWIGLFRVPWSSVKDKVYYHYVSMLSSWKEESDKHGNVVFQGEFYNLPQLKFSFP